MDRRDFLVASAAAAGGAFALLGGAPRRVAAAGGLPAASTKEHAGRIFKSIKYGMFDEAISVREKLQALREIGYDGVEIDSPGGVDKKEALEASRATGLPIHGAVDSIHWGVRLSDPDAAVRDKGVEGLLTALKDVHLVGGSAVLLVPGAVRDAKNENQEQVWERSIAGIRKVLPTAAKLGVRVLIENVWNGFCYIHDGPENQTAAELARYIDEIDSPWVGVYFDIGNHQKYGKPAEWIRLLGRRIVKLDVKDWGKANGFCKIGEGDVDWTDVRKALAEIRFTGWCTAEVESGNRDVMRDIAQRMDRALGL